MSKLIMFSDTTRQCWARVELASGEPIFISIGQGAILIKRSKFGFFGPKLLTITDLHKTVEIALRMYVQSGSQLTPPEMSNRILISCTQFVLECSSCAELCVKIRNIMEGQQVSEEDLLMRELIDKINGN